MKNTYGSAARRLLLRRSPLMMTERLNEFPNDGPERDQLLEKKQKRNETKEGRTLPTL